MLPDIVPLSMSSVIDSSQSEQPQLLPSVESNHSTCTTCATRTTSATNATHTTRANCTTLKQDSWARISVKGITIEHDFSES